MAATAAGSYRAIAEEPETIPPARSRLSRAFFRVVPLALASTALFALVFGLSGWSDTTGSHHARHLLAPTQEEVCSEYLGVPAPAGGFSVILTADPGTFSGTPESHHFLSNLRAATAKPVNGSVCALVSYGQLMGQDVLVATTGIGPTAAGLCALEIVTNCGSSINDIIYFGTSGWSPQLGGVLNPPNCTKANNNKKITRMGDVCISPVSVNWVCKKASWNQQAAGYPNQCTNPQETAGPDANYLYGECIFATDNLDANLQLADSLIAAARSNRGRAAMPTRIGIVQNEEVLFWGLMANGTGLNYPAVKQNYTPAVWDYKQCAEVDGQFFYSGTPWEIEARDYVSEAIGMMIAEKNNGSTAGAPGPDKVIAVAAMEGVGVAEALFKYNRLDSTSRPIPYTNVRTLSNYLHYPVGKAGNGVWKIYQETPEDYVNGYAYAIATGSATVMSLFQRRCLAARARSMLEAEDAAAAAEAQQQEQQRRWLLGGAREAAADAGVGAEGVQEKAAGAVGSELGRRAAVGGRRSTLAASAVPTECQFTIEYPGGRVAK